MDKDLWLFVGLLGLIGVVAWAAGQVDKAEDCDG